MKNKVSIVIVSYNNIYLMQKCIESIRNTCEVGAYEVIVVDNASTDGVREWLSEQEDLKVILLDENVGFPMGCNIGASYAEPGYDIFLLNNDTRLCEKSLENLINALNSDDEIGAVGAVANYSGNKQEIDAEFGFPAEYVEFGDRYNNEAEARLEYRIRLCGFAMLIRRDVWNELSGLDEEFTPGYYEDDDISMRITMAGYKLAVCSNAFIYHAGSQSFAHREGLEEIVEKNYQYFVSKYGFFANDYAYGNELIIQNIPFERTSSFNALIIGAKLGADIDLIKTYYPNANVVGIENDSALQRFASGAKSVLKTVSELNELVTGRIFNLVYILNDEALGNSERALLAGMLQIDAKVYTIM